MHPQISVGRVSRPSVRLFTMLLLLAGAAPAVAAEALGPWKQDGHWQIEPIENGVVLRTDETHAHNRIAWVNVPQQSYRGWTIHMQVRIPAPFGHGDLFIADGDAGSDRDAVVKNMAEVWSFGGVPDTGWRDVTWQITTDEPINTLGVLAWGWPLDMNLPISIRGLSLTPPSEPVTWFKWPQEDRINTRTVPRNVVQDFFPFGFYVAADLVSRRAADLGITLEQSYDNFIGDMVDRGMNYAYFTNVRADHLPIIATTAERWGLYYGVDVGEANPKYAGGTEATLAAARRLAETYRDDRYLLTWGFGEEYDPPIVSLLDGYYQMLHKVAPQKAMSIIQYRIDAIYADAQRHDVQIAMRDAYPFYVDLPNGPVAYPAQLNYYESEIDLSWRFLPENATLWAMPQSAELFLTPERMVYTIDRPNQIRVQAWAALAWGARGVVYFYYAGLIPDEQGNPRADVPMGVLTPDWRPSPWLTEATAVAKQLTPLGPLLARLERTNQAIESDQADLRAYLVRHIGTGQHYVIAYNRSIESPVTGRIRVPFAVDATVLNVVSGQMIASQNEDGHGIIPVTIAPGDGVIVRLHGANP